MAEKLRKRHYLVFVMPVFSFIPLTLIILAMTGLLGGEQANIERAIEFESRVMLQKMDEQFVKISEQAVLFSQTLSRSIENRIKELYPAAEAPPVSALSGRTGELEKIMGAQVELALYALDRSDVTGAFIILDATVNPALPNARYSRTGLYLKKAEPAVASLPMPKICLRGFSSVAFANSFRIPFNWDLEFDVADAPYYRQPLEGFYRNPSLPLSRLYHWSLVPGLEEEGNVVFCSVPLIGQAGRVLGVCGFEISAWNFRRRCNPAGGTYSNLAAMLGPALSRETDGEAGLPLFSGNPVLYRELEQDGTALEQTGADGRILSVFRNAQGKIFTGKAEQTQLYRENSPFLGRDFSLLTVMPKADFDRAVLAWKARFALALGIALLAGCAASWVLIRRFLTRIRAEAAKKPPVEFEKLGLSPREAEICRMLLKGLTLRQIGLELSISFDTVNTHYRAVYRKLGVSSRGELFMKYGN
jgi:DNA-binding CsgD family transcriptional regulator